VITLPSNHRDNALMVETGQLSQAELDAYHELERRRLEEVAENDRQLGKLVLDGKMSGATAQICRGFYVEPNDPRWTPPEPPAPPRPALPWYPQSPMAGNGAAVEAPPTEIELPAKTVLYPAPNSRWAIGKGYIADRWGVITDVEAEDVEALIRAGCSRWRGNSRG
jgi:hypothetical protein